jgi:glycosidase
MAHLVPLDFWKQARTVLDAEKELFWLAETEEAVYHEVFDASYAWEFLHTMEAVYKGGTNADGLRAVLEKYLTVFPPNALRAYFTTNHDENSHSGSEYERLGDSAKAFAVLCATLPNSIPLVYSGQELPNRKRLKFFEKDEIEWNGRYLLHDFYKRLLELRRNNNAFVSGNYVQLTTNNNDKVLAFAWRGKESEVLVFFNLSWTSYVRFNIESEITGRYRNVFSGVQLDIKTSQFELQAWEYLVYEKV